MGGNAFTDLHTPRMPPATYFAIKQRIQALLEIHFKKVNTPTEAPGKDDYGDLDFIVCQPFVTPEPPTNEKASKTHTPQYKTEHIATMIGATHFKRAGSFDSWNFALPWPETENLPPLDGDQSAAKDGPARYIQVDISVVSNLGDFKWMGWMHAHGDLNMIITLIVRRKCLRISEKGFFASIPEIEKDSPKLAEVFITKDPDLVMRFLGLDGARFYQPFLSWDALMDWAATCRFHNPGFGRKVSEDNSGVSTPLEGQEEAREDIGGDKMARNEQSATPDVSKDDAATAYVKIPTENACNNASIAAKAVRVDLELKTTDKKRRVLRPMYRYWIDEYIPAHVDDPPRSAASLTKLETLAEAKKFFGEDFASRYDDQRALNMKRALEPKLWKAMRDFLHEERIETGEATTTFKGWKRELTGDVNELAVDLNVDGLVEAREAFIEMKYGECLEWGKEHWKDIWERQAKIDKDKSDASYRAKFEREAAAQMEQAGAADADIKKETGG